MGNDSKLHKSMKKWEDETVSKTIKRFPEREDHFETISGIPMNRLYTPLDLKDMNYEKDLGFPGEYPFTRGVQATGYRGRFWTMRQYSGFATAKETNQRFKFLLEQGQTGLSISELYL